MTLDREAAGHGKRRGADAAEDPRGRSRACRPPRLPGTRRRTLGRDLGRRRREHDPYGVLALACVHDFPRLDGRSDPRLEPEDVHARIDRDRPVDAGERPPVDEDSHVPYGRTCTVAQADANRREERFDLGVPRRALRDEGRRACLATYEKLGSGGLEVLFTFQHLRVLVGCFATDLRFRLGGLRSAATADREGGGQPETKEATACHADLIMQYSRSMRDLIRPVAAVAFGIAILGSGAPGCSLEGLSGGSSARDLDAGGSADVENDRSFADDAAACAGCEVLVSGEDRPTEITLVDDRLFWLRATNNGFVVRSRVDGTDLVVERDHPIANPHDLIATVRQEAFAVSSDATLKRYFSYSTCDDAMGVLRLAVFGEGFLVVKSAGLFRGECGGSTLLVAESITAVDGDAPFAWYARDSGEIVRCEASASCGATRAVLAAGQGPVTTIAHDETRVFWIPAGAPEIRSRSKSTAGSAGVPEVTATGAHPQTLAPAGGNVYWTDIEEGTVVRTSVSTKVSTVIARGLSRPWGIVAGPAHLYVTESGAGRILRLPR